MQKIFVSFLLFSCFQQFWSQDSSIPSQNVENQTIRYEADLSKVQIARPFMVSYYMPENISILEVNPEFDAQEETDVSVLDLQKNSFTVKVTPYAITNYPMPPLQISVIEESGITNTISTPSFDIPISGSPIKNKDLSFIDIEQPYFVWNHLWTVLILILGFLFLLFFLIPRRQKPKSPIPVVKVDPYKEFRDKLKELDLRSKALDDLNQKIFFVDLSEATREFLSRTIIPLAMEIPSRELISQLKLKSKDEEFNEAISFIIHTTDRAKYAKQVFGEERVSVLMKESERAVDILERKEEESSNEL